MKRLLKPLFLALMLVAAIPATFALDPEECGSPRGRFTNISFAYSHLNQDEMPKIHSNIGVALSKGTTYYLHKPIGGFLRFGIDAVWTDITYTNYKVAEHFYDYTDEYSIHSVDIGMQAGVSGTVNFCKRLQAQAYFRYNPTLALLYNDGEMQAGFANMFVGGVSVNYGVIGLGIETRFGRTKMKSYFNIDDFYGDDDSDDAWDSVGTSDKKKVTRLSGLRAFISFRF